ncbi:MAG TPA: hypothetical protein VHK47_06785 [Polyangia bacterium]|nr:hypothetical protein [Polyangia bacterium]
MSDQRKAIERRRTAQSKVDFYANEVERLGAQLRLAAEALAGAEDELAIAQSVERHARAATLAVSS